MSTYNGPPHPDYPNMIWSDPRVEGLVLAAIEKSVSPAAAVKAIMEVYNSFSYDSMDREMAFWIATQLKGWDYNDLYDEWLNQS